MYLEGNRMEQGCSGVLPVRTQPKGGCRGGGATHLSMYLGGSRRRLWQQLLQKILPHILREIRNTHTGNPSYPGTGNVTFRHLITVDFEERSKSDALEGSESRAHRL